MGSNAAEQLILCWSREFSADELSVEDIQDRLGALEPGDASNLAVRKRIIEAKQELDAIRYGMRERGQRAEIARIFRELEALIANNRH